MLRLITIGRKTLPSKDDGDRNHWGFVDRVFRSPDELRKALSVGTVRDGDTRRAASALRSACRRRGVRAGRAGRSSVLAYASGLPEEPGEVQHAFHIEREGQFVLSIKNPEAAARGDRPG